MYTVSGVDEWFRLKNGFDTLWSRTVREHQRAESCHRHGPKTVLAQTAEITKCHVIFIVFFKFLIEIAGGDGINQFLLKIRAFWCIICLCSCSEQKSHQFFLKVSHSITVTSSSDIPRFNFPWKRPLRWSLHTINAYYSGQKRFQLPELIDWFLLTFMNVQEKLILTVINYGRKDIERKLDFQERRGQARRKLHYYFILAVTKSIIVKSDNERM